jgi:hypothetical protein
MAIRTFGNGSNSFTVTGLLNGDQSSANLQPNSGDRSVQVTGTFGAGGTVIVEGSLDGTNWFQLKDAGGTLISFTAAGLKAVLEYTTYIRFNVTAGDGTTNLTGILASKDR